MSKSTQDNILVFAFPKKGGHLSVEPMSTSEDILDSVRAALGRNGWLNLTAAIVHESEHSLWSITLCLDGQRKQNRVSL